MSIDGFIFFWICNQIIFKNIFPNIENCVFLNIYCCEIYSVFIVWSEVGMGIGVWGEVGISIGVWREVGMVVW